MDTEHVCAHVYVQLLQSCLTLCGTMDHSPPGSSVHGILQERRLEWVAMPSSRGSPQPRDRTCVSYAFCIDRWVLYHKRHLGSLWLLRDDGKSKTQDQHVVVAL